MDLERFEERSAILEFDEGMTRFAAETEAARRQGFKRYEVINAIRARDFAGRGNNGSTARRDAENNLPGMLRNQKEEA